MQSASVDFWDRCFWTSKKRGTHLYAARSQGESGGDASAIRDATGSDHRDANGVHHLRDKSHRQERRPALADHFAVMPDAIFATVLDLRDFSAVSGHRNGD